MDMPLPAQLGHFQILDRLGQGGFTEVLLARDLRPSRMGELVALKRLRPGLIQRDPVFLESLLIEAELGMLVDNPHVVKVACVVEAEGEPALVMEYVEGYRLDILQKLGEGRGLPPEVASSVAAQVAAGLAAIHAAQDASGRPLRTVHQDIKPGNILVTRGGVARVLDFNTARPHREGQAFPVWIRQGTPGYRSPEQTRGEWRLTPASDVYGLGVVLFELLTGARLFPNLPSEPEGQLTRQKQISLKIEMLASKIAPPGLDALLSRMLAWSPDERQGNAAELSQALDLWVKIWAPRFSLAEYLTRHRVRLEALALRHKSEQDIHRVDTEVGERRQGPTGSSTPGTDHHSTGSTGSSGGGGRTAARPPVQESSAPKTETARRDPIRSLPPGVILRSAPAKSESERPSSVQEAPPEPSPRTSMPGVRTTAQPHHVPPVPWQQIPFQQPPWLEPRERLPVAASPRAEAPGRVASEPLPRGMQAEGELTFKPEPTLPSGRGMNAVQPGSFDGPAWHPPKGTPAPKALKLPPDPRTSQPGYREPARVSGSWTPSALLGQLARPFARRHE